MGHMAKSMVGRLAKHGPIFYQHFSSWQPQHNSSVCFCAFLSLILKCFLKTKAHLCFLEGAESGAASFCSLQETVNESHQAYAQAFDQLEQELGATDVEKNCSDWGRDLPHYPGRLLSENGFYDDHALGSISKGVGFRDTDEGVDYFTLS